MEKSTNVWDRLLLALDADNLDQVATRLEINPSTLRGRKARGALPLKKIVQKLNTEQLVFVLKNKKIDQLISVKEKQNAIQADESTSYDEELFEKTASEFESFLVSVIHRIEDAPFSKEAKLQIVDLLIRTVDADLRKVSQRNNDSDVD